MILTDDEIISRIKHKNISIEPFNEENLTPNGYDLTVGEIYIPEINLIVKKGSANIPGKMWFLISTMEYVKMGEHTGQLWLRTTYARKGILGSFGKIDAGFEGTLTLSLYNASEKTHIISVGERIVQIVFEHVMGNVIKDYEERSGKYQRQIGIEMAKEEKILPTDRRQVCRKYDCSECCHDTEMLLTNEDIKRIEALGFKREYFVEEVDGWLKLKNTSEGKCYFLEGNICSIYRYRPEGCRYYPMVIDETGKIVLDDDCPHKEKYTFNDVLERYVRNLVNRMIKERRVRLRRKMWL